MKAETEREGQSGSTTTASEGTGMAGRVHAAGTSLYLCHQKDAASALPRGDEGLSLGRGGTVCGRSLALRGA